MKVRLLTMVIIVGLALLAVGLVVAAWMGRPSLLEVTPQPGEENVSAATPIRLVFSRAMRPDSVEQRLMIEPAVSGGFNWDKHTLNFTPDHAWPSGHEIKISFSAGSRAASWLTFPMESRQWSFFTSQTYLAYLWPADGPADIFTLSPETGEVQQLTSVKGVLEYTLSSDGRRVYFSASNAQGGSDLFQLDRLQADPSTGAADAIVLLSCGLAQCRSPAVSLDGKYLAYEYLPYTAETGLSLVEIWLVNLASIHTSQVSQIGHETVQPAWSSGGWLAYYDRTEGEYEMVNPLTQARQQYSNQTGQPGAWSPDGQSFLAPKIDYHRSAGTGETGTSHLIQYRVEAGVSEVLSQGEVEDVAGVYSPDGGRIAFARKFLDAEHWSLGRQIWIMNADGSEVHPITDAADYNHYDLAWRQDGLKIAYVRFNQATISAPPELWVVNADGSDPIELVVGGYSPLWIP